MPALVTYLCPMTPAYYAKLAEVGGQIPDRFTPEWLDAAAKKADATMANGRTDLAELHWIQEQCARAAGWMRENAIADARYVGALRANPYVKGQEFLVPKGAKIRCNGEWLTAKRSYRVKLYMVFDGHSDIDHGKVFVRNPSVSWAGAGGYWMDLDLSSLPS